MFSTVLSTQKKKKYKNKAFKTESAQSRRVEQIIMIHK